MHADLHQTAEVQFGEIFSGRDISKDYFLRNWSNHAWAKYINNNKRKKSDFTQ